MPSQDGVYQRSREIIFVTTKTFRKSCFYSFRSNFLHFENMIQLKKANNCPRSQTGNADEMLVYFSMLSGFSMDDVESKSVIKISSCEKM
jgi:hypothetical protein